ncbi:MAG: hypothetical protein KH586_10315, partial [Tannerella sp.]|nr:hypothetical protein [Tannerella sp.]
MLGFTHVLAKVRVTLQGDQADKVTDVEIQSYTSCTHTNGTNIQGSNESWITMKECDYHGIGKCWEANVVPGHPITDFQVNGTEGKFNGDGITPLEAKINTITLTVKSVVPEDAKEITGDISDNSNYVVRGTRNEAINIIGGSPAICLENANINVSNGNAINIMGGNPTIHVQGDNSISTNNNGAGVYVAKNSNVTIMGHGRNDVMTAQAGGDAAGIGGCSNQQDCGTINISNVTVIARGSRLLYCSPGIGSTQTDQCGDITIDNATVHAYGTEMPNTCACPGIGAGLDISGSTGTVLPNVTGNNSEVHTHTHRGSSYADYIGLSYFLVRGGGQ